MGSYTPNYGLYKPDIGETDWGDKVNANFDTIDSEMNKNRSDIDNILNNIIPSLRDDIAYNETLISKIKKDVLTIALNVMMHKALLHAETKDFYSIIADVITDEYPNGFKNTFETLPTGVTFDNGGGGTWTQAIKITLTTVPSEYAQYKIVIQSNTMQIYAADGTLKADYGASTGVASDFWNNVKSDGSDIRIADQNYAQLYFWIEEFDYSGKYAVIWVKIPANTTELYIVYGNANALPSTYNSGENTFEFFDDFEGDSLDTTKWNIVSGVEGTDFVVSNGKLVIYSTTTRIQSIVNGFANSILITKVSASTEPEHGIMLNGFYASASQAIGWKPFAAYDHVYVDGSWIQLSKTTVVNDIYTSKLIVKSDDTAKLEIYSNGQLFDSWSGTYTASKLANMQITLGERYDNTCAGESCNVSVYYVILAKLADPASFGDAEVITLTTTGDFITVTFDFPEGVDKLLITVDSDAQAVYYSTDNGQTWNPITPDTETLLSETVYSVKWKFENATYVRGYAFITW